MVSFIAMFFFELASHLNYNEWIPSQWRLKFVRFEGSIE